MAGIAFFDLDKTITREGTWSRFVRLATPDIRFFAGLPALAAQAAAYKAGMASRGSVKERAIALFLRDRKKAELRVMQLTKQRNKTTPPIINNATNEIATIIKIV